MSRKYAKHIQEWFYGVSEQTKYVSKLDGNPSSLRLRTLQTQVMHMFSETDIARCIRD